MQGARTGRERGQIQPAFEGIRDLAPEFFWLLREFQRDWGVRKGFEGLFRSLVGSGVDAAYAGPGWDIHSVRHSQIPRRIARGYPLARACSVVHPHPGSHSPVGNGGLGGCLRDSHNSMTLATAMPPEPPSCRNQVAEQD
jgi:hypothetical protein